MLWVGWFGFNVGPTWKRGARGIGLYQYPPATAAAAMSWMFFEWLMRGKPTMLGAASGAISGLVAITPACGFVGPMGAILIGLIAGVLCLWAVVWLKSKLGYDDSLDVFGVHCIGGIFGVGHGHFAAPSLGARNLRLYQRPAIASRSPASSRFSSRCVDYLICQRWCRSSP